MSERILKINNLIKKELALIIAREIEPEPETLITINRVDTSSDLAQAKIYISAIPQNNQTKIIKKLIKNRAKLQSQLNQKLILRKIPRLIFIDDKSQSNINELDQILENLT